MCFNLWNNLFWWFKLISTQVLNPKKKGKKKKKYQNSGTVCCYCYSSCPNMLAELSCHVPIQSDAIQILYFQCSLKPFFCNIITVPSSFLCAWSIWCLLLSSLNLRIKVPYQKWIFFIGEMYRGFYLRLFSQISPSMFRNVWFVFSYFPYSGANVILTVH